MKYVIAWGDAFNGIILYGLFNSIDEAWEEADDKRLDKYEIVAVQSRECFNNI